MVTDVRKATKTDHFPPVAVGAITTSTIMYPVDVLRGICMANPGTGTFAAYRSFLNAHGYIGFLKQGLVAEITIKSLARTGAFWLQPIFHEVLFRKPERHGTPLTKGVSGMAGTFPPMVLIAVFENFKLAAQLDREKKFKGSYDVARHLVKTRGVFGGFYIGYVGMQLRNCLGYAGFFLSVDVFKCIIKNDHIPEMLCDGISGFFAGCVGAVLNCWADVGRSVVQKRAVAETFDLTIPRPSAFNNLNPVPFFAEVANIFSSMGIRGLYSGILPKMIHMSGSFTLMAIVMPRFKRAWFEFNDIEE